MITTIYTKISTYKKYSNIVHILACVIWILKKLRSDIDIEPSFKHLGLEIKVKSSKQSCVLEVLYQPNFKILARE